MPRHCLHQASAPPGVTDAGPVTAMTRRTGRQGRFEPEDLGTLGVVPPCVRAAATAARAASTDGARRRAEPFERRGEPVLYVGANGRVVESNPEAERARGTLFTLVEKRVATVLPADQHRLDGALKAALDGGRPSLVTLTSFSGTGRVMALALPMDGRARDVFHAVSALVVFLETGRERTTDERSLALLREATGLTAREADVVRLIAGGATPRQAAQALRIGPGTARLHLKAAFAKCGVHGQAELAALIHRLG